MEVLKKQRSVSKSKFTRIKTYRDNCIAGTAYTNQEIVTKLKLLDEAWTQFQHIHNQIIALTDEKDLDLEDAVNAEVEEKYCALDTQLRELIVQSSSSSTSSSASTPIPPYTPPSAVVDIKLPRMDLPTFSGNPLEWKSFHDLFTSMIHSNSKISAAQKLHYLKNSVQDEASSLLSSIDITDANYLEAWNLLKERYENERQLIHCHLKCLFAQSTLTSESSKNLRTLIDTTTKCVRSLRALGVSTDEWDPILVFHVTEKLDNDSRRQWELQSPNKTYPKFKDLKIFIEQRCRALEATSSKSNVHNSSSRSNKLSTQSTSSHHSSSSTPSCSSCGSSHFIYHCPAFLRLDVKDKKNSIKQLRLCYNCLRPNHSAQQCPSKSSCRKCNGRHHTLVHSSQPQQADPSENKKVEPAVTSHYSNPDTWSPALLSTAVVEVKDVYDKYQSIRVLLDNGSQCSFITDDCVKRLGLRISKSNVHVNGIGGSSSSFSKGLVNIKLKSLQNSFIYPLQALVMRKITGKVPNQFININEWSQLSNIKLADASFNKPGHIDLLLGADAYEDIVTEGKIPGSNGQPAIRNTQFGWVLSGRTTPLESTQVTSHITTFNIDEELKKFWELEELSSPPLLSDEEIQCESHFDSTHFRTDAGRFVTCLPMKVNSIPLGYSKQMAMKRFMSIERKLTQNPEYRQQYDEFMDKYLKLGHMELIPKHEHHEIPGMTNYLPHHFVLKQSSSTTSFRVVFDASAKTSTGQSLNDNLMVGPTIQEDMVNILLRFRFYKYAFTADIAKMYRQILVTKDDSNLLRILWRQQPSDPIEEYRLLTVTYGTASAPYTATKTLQQISKDEGDDFPLAKEIALRDFYVDDVMSGSNSLDLSLQIQSQLIEMLARGGMELRKWSCNHDSLLAAVPPEYRETSLPLCIDNDDSIKALGLHWNPSGDYFFFKVNLSTDSAVPSKRIILSETARLFDPLGWLSPIIIIAKSLFQNLWVHGLSWDDQLPQELEDAWKRFRQQLPLVQTLHIPRHVGPNPISYQLHGFSDASEQAYASVVYLRTEQSNGEVSVHLLSSKTKVAPVKSVSIPKLELCGALLLARHIVKVSSSLRCHIQEIHGWTDSTVTLGWISGYPNQWKTFVANRVTLIQERLPPSQWHHVPGDQNPADIASRGMYPEDFIKNEFWWNGPEYLKLTSNAWPTTPPNLLTGTAPERRIMKVMVTSIDEPWNLITKFSSLSKLKRITAYCIRFIHNLKSNVSNKRAGPLTNSELQTALLFWIKLIQKIHFSTTLKALAKGQSVDPTIRRLNPFVDEDDILRVGGRLHYSSIKYDQKHPMLLPKKSPLTQLIITEEHLRLLHAGPQLLLSSINRKFWIVGARSLIRQYVHKCIKCWKDRPKTATQLMGDLPSYRIEPTRPFLNAGVDFGGPFLVKSAKGRGGKVTKAYISLFICLCTKAVHIELVSDLTMEAFLAALKRFISRRGHCTNLYSDNGTNFVGSCNELKKLASLVKKSTTIFTQAELTWHFIPSKAPHFGGIWEAGIKSVKTHLRKVVADTVLTYEELLTTLCQVEACLNSRPLCPISSNPSDLEALTPGHFLIGCPLTSIPEPGLTHLKVNRLSRWQLTQQLSQHFWRRWQREYLSNLQTRTKWTEAMKNLAVGDLVLIKEENLPPQQWIMGRVIEVHPGRDNRVRVVSVKTGKGVYKRPVVKLCPLPIV